MTELEIYNHFINNVLITETHLEVFYHLKNITIQQIDAPLDFIISNFDDFLEENEENYLKNNFHNWSSIEIDNFYGDCLNKIQQSISQELDEILSVKKEIFKKGSIGYEETNFKNELDDLKNNFFSTEKNYLQLKRKLNKAIQEFEKNTKLNCLFIAKKHGQDSEIAKEAYNDALISFFKILLKKPDDEGFFAFKNDKNDNSKANMFSYFNTIYRFKLIDTIRKERKWWPEDNLKSLKDDINAPNPFYSSPPTLNEFDEENKLGNIYKTKVKYGILKLRETCREILTLKWLGEKELSNLEISQKLKIALGTVNNNSGICRVELVNIISQTVSLDDYVGEYVIKYKNSIKRIDLTLDKNGIIFQFEIQNWQLNPIIKDVFNDLEGRVYKFERKKNEIESFEVQFSDIIIKGIKRP